MKIGSTCKGWKFLYEVRVQVAAPSYNRGKLLAEQFLDEDKKLRERFYPALAPKGEQKIYVTPAGVAKRASGVQLSDRGAGGE